MSKNPPLPDLQNQLPWKDDFLIDLANNNYSTETIYNYGRDLMIFEKFIQSRNVSFQEISKRVISLYKGFLRSGKHLEIIEDLREKEILMNSGIEGVETLINSEEVSPSGSEGSVSDESVAGTTRGRLNAMQTSSLSARSVNRMLSALRTYLKYLIDFDLECPIAPEAIKLIKAERKESQVADLDELVQIIEAPAQFESDDFVRLRNIAMLELLFSTGMRISELINLNMDQINVEGKIYIMGKGKKQRMVYLTERAKGKLNEYVKKREKVGDSPALFVSIRGSGKFTRKNRLTPRYVQMKIKEYRKYLGIVVPVTPHGLRHGFATYLAEEGASPAAIQRLLGHESLNTTTRYIHASDKFAEDTHKKFHPLAVE